jgi:hypothetical protein
MKYLIKQANYKINRFQINKSGIHLYHLNNS